SEQHADKPECGKHVEFARNKKFACTVAQWKSQGDNQCPGGAKMLIATELGENQYRNNNIEQYIGEKALFPLGLTGVTGLVGDWLSFIERVCHSLGSS